ncbi:unnamed protein product [Cercospora beticola]|nr:unnamed protein product [Cercospora beticola]
MKLSLAALLVAAAPFICAAPTSDLSTLSSRQTSCPGGRDRDYCIYNEGFRVCSNNATGRPDQACVAAFAQRCNQLCPAPAKARDVDSAPITERQSSCPGGQGKDYCKNYVAWQVCRPPGAPADSSCIRQFHARCDAEC